MTCYHPTVVFALFFVSLACGLDTFGWTDETSRASTSGSFVELSSGSTVDPGDTSIDGPTDVESGSMPSTTTGAAQDSSETGAAETEDPMAHCDPFAQDCPEGFKCAAYASKGDLVWDANMCVPIMGDGQAGEGCTVEGSAVSGYDSCAAGFMCAYPDAINEGICVALCTSMNPCTPLECVVTHGGVLNLCLMRCNPLTQDCPQNEVCVATFDENFACVFDDSGPEGQDFDPCTHLNACDPGYLCGDSDHALECDTQIDSCCLQFCEVGFNTCPGAGQTCQAWFAEDAPAGYELVGSCGIPR